MTYKTVKQLNGSILYFVNNQAEVASHPNLNCVIGNDTDTATAKLLEVQKAFLERDSYLFGCNKEIIDGSNTIWTSVDFENDPEDASYHVFNHFTGSHEVINNLSQAKLRVEELKQQTIQAHGFDTVGEIDFLPEPLTTPNSSTIPVTGV